MIILEYWLYGYAFSSMKRAGHATLTSQRRRAWLGSQSTATKIDILIGVLLFFCRKFTTVCLKRIIKSLNNRVHNLYQLQ